MENRILAGVGRVAGLGGIALGVVLLIFQGVLKTQFLPQTGLTSDQAFAVVLSLMTFTFGIAGIGVVAWLIGRTVNPKQPASFALLGMLSGLIVLVVGAALYIGGQAKPNFPSRVDAREGAIAVGGNVTNSSLSIRPMTNAPSK